MTPSILFDQSNTVFRMGTGIATYARNLAAAARQCGFTPQALISTDIKIDPRNPALAEVQLADVRRDPALPWLKSAISSIEGAIRAPFGYRPQRLPRAGMVMRSAGGDQLEHSFVATRLFDAARAYFYLHGRFAKVRLPQPPNLFHATHPLPVQVSGCANIVTIHDLVPLRLPNMTLDNKRYFFRLIQALVARADHIVTVSEFS